MTSALDRMLPVADYDLAATLNCGQAFRWRQRAAGWEGVIGRRWVRLQQAAQGLAAQVVTPADPAAAGSWGWLEDYLQIRTDLAQVLSTFPDDPPLRAAVAQCRGLRLLRQPPWECLASFLLSSNKQIAQIRQIISQLCQRYGEAVAVPPGHEQVFAFPTAERLAQCSEAELRACKMGFRAAYLLEAAQRVAEGRVRLEEFSALTLKEARVQLLRLPGVGPKIADCVLLFSCGFSAAFPVDVWVRKALRQLYFPKRRPAPARLRHFAATHFGPHAGYAQQYLFHYMRLASGKIV
jgi:N-glycosylase/DNA lyase